MKQIMCAHLPHWPIDRLRRSLRSSSPENPRPIVLVQTIASRQLVTIASEEALSLGARPKMTLAQAQALSPKILHAPYTPQRDRRTLESLARYLTRFSPIVSLPPNTDCQPPTPNDYLFLDITGCHRAFGNLHNLVKQVHQTLQSIQLHARIAVAPTPGAAYAIASASKYNGQIIPPTQIPNALAPLPTIALRINPNTAQTLLHLGIQTIGQLIQLPRHTIPPRFGPEILTRIDQALGYIPEPLTPLPSHNPIQAHIHFDDAINSPETLSLVFKSLIGQVVSELSRRGSGAKKITLQFDRPHAPKITKTILLSKPSRNAANLFNLLQCAVEGLKHNPQQFAHTTPKNAKITPPTLADNSLTIPPSGFTGIRLAIPVFEPISHHQIPLLQQEKSNPHAELDLLIQRLILRLGDQAIARFQLVESYLPEQAYQLTTNAKQPPVKNACLPSPLQHHPLLRPLYLLNHPIKIDVMASPSHDDHAKPVSFTQNGQVHPLSHVTGPERIAAPWWQEHNTTRDYFAVQDASGRQFWLFHARETRKWYLHGSFD